eukprot:TRINITY_DN2379_c0_g1_i1.p1 TRINITY_DN2379_c0_g1~~TRINITY_DN2379_c0_g1_i1.p1  ORF type:complete len:505 (-),score=134.62 TRINITY_DN2379_c0_g1_i1:163-1677(-)
MVLFPLTSDSNSATYFVSLSVSFSSLSFSFSPPFWLSLEWSLAKKRTSSKACSSSEARSTKVAMCCSVVLERARTLRYQRRVRALSNTTEQHMATFVDLASEEEQALELVRFFAKLHSKDSQKGGEKEKDKEEKETESETKYVAELESLVKGNKTIELLNKISESHALLFAHATDAEIEVCFNVFCSLLRKLDPTGVNQIVKKLISILVSSKTEKTSLRLKILNNLYNMFDSDSLSRYEVFVSIVQYAHESKSSELVIPHFPKVDSWMKIWRVGVEQRRSLYKLISQVLRDNELSLDAHKYLVKHLSTFDAKDTEALKTAVNDAAAAAVEAIRLPEIFQSDHLLEIPAIRQMEKDGNENHAKLYQLLKLFAVDKLDAFYAFQEKNPGFLTSVGLTYEDCLKKIRLLSLATLATENEEIPYALISKTLQIDESEVESWVIFAVSGKILEAKMNQVRKVVVVQRCTQRVFADAQWKQLSVRLNSWKDNVNNLLGLLQSGFLQPTVN